MAQVSDILSKLDLTELPFLRTKRIVAVDIGDVVIKYVELDFTATKPRIMAFDIIPVPDSHKESKNKEAHDHLVSSLIDESFKKNKVTAKDIAFVISGGSVFSRKIRIPKLGGKERESGIKWEASNQIPFSLDSSYFDWHLLREVTMPDHSKNDEYMIAASSRKTVDDMINCGLEIGLRPLCVGIPIFAIFNLVKVSPQFNVPGPIAVIDIGPRRTNITIIEEKNIVFAREIPIGDDNFTEAIVGEFVSESWSFSIADEMKRQKKLFKMCMHDEHNIEDLMTRRMMRVIRPLLERVFNEIKRSFDYFREQTEGAVIKKIALSGKGAMTEGFDQIFSKIFSLPVEFLNMSDLVVADQGVDVEKLGANMLDLAIVLGLAIGRDKQINFVPMQYKERSAILAQLFISSLLVLLLLMLVFLLIFQVNLKVSKLEKEIQVTNDQMAYIVPQITAFNDKCATYKRDKEYMDKLRSRQLLLENALKELSNIVPRAITFKEIDLMDDGWLKIDGYVFDDTVAEMASEAVLTDFIIAIENSPFFTEVRLDSSVRGSKFEVTHSVFLINCKIISRKDIKEI
jgi:type IV pilus assembly protein PilM